MLSSTVFTPQEYALLTFTARFAGAGMVIIGRIRRATFERRATGEVPFGLGAEKEWLGWSQESGEAFAVIDWDDPLAEDEGAYRGVT